MVELTAELFKEFFEALWSKPDKTVTPFAWQLELAQRVITNTDKPWPDAIALPTASGKTACIDIAVFALAARAERLKEGNPLTAPRRIFYVVDRRVIVDEAYDRARRLAKRLQEAQDGILKEVANRLRTLAGGGEPLTCFELRGGMYRSDAWAKSPLQPAIVASTVDQIGSRLLFRGYGHNFKAWPIQAGLIGNDSLILLDEAHCAQPFLETLQSVSKYRTWAEEPLSAPFHIVVMSATPPEGLRDMFRDESNEPRTKGHPLGNRQQAKKPAVLKPLDNQANEEGRGQQWNPKKQLADLRQQAGQKLSRDIVECAKTLVGGRPLATVIFVNRVATARQAHQLLVEKHGYNAVLLTGRMRPIDRDDTVMNRLALLSADSSEGRQLEAPVFVVATQTLEVGANLDFDVLVTECASLDALRQRFGRLNRMGRDIEAKAAILVQADQSKKSDDDPVYGVALAETWKWLNRQAGETGEIDMGIAALAERLPTGEELARLSAPAANAPVMLPAHVDCWAQTAPEPMPTPEVALFLHGSDRATADVHVCWRTDLDLSTDESEKLSQDVLSLCPPATAECLPVRIWVFRHWLAGESQTLDDSDVEGMSEAKNGERRGGADQEIRKVLRWRGRGEAEAVSDPDAIRPGDVVVIPASLGGWETLGDLPRIGDAAPVLDWGDRAHRQARAKAMLRLHPAAIEQWPTCDSKALFIEIASQATSLFEEDADALVDQLRESLGALAQDTSAPRWLREIAGHLAVDRKLRQGITLHPLAGLVLRGSRRLPMPSEDADSFSDEDDASASGTVSVLFTKHSEGVADFAQRFASGCGLHQDLVEAIEQAGLLHDLGKVDLRFQALLRGGNSWATGELLAKSEDIPQGYVAYKRACKVVGYPEGGRHELLSVRLAESEAGLLPNDKPIRDVMLHLIESHHGHCRPFAPVVFDEKPVSVKFTFQERELKANSDTKLEQIDSGTAERFWHLTRHYGWWGLALLEAILRLADHRKSEAEEDRDERVRA